MLTESERKWLGRRNLFAGINFSCQWCDQLNVNREGFKTPCGAFIYGCPRVDMEGNDNDVEFEARVAAKLAKAFKEYVKRRNCVDFEVGARCPGWEVCAADYKKRLPCDFAIMKGVQLEVEEEMDAEV